MNLETVLNWVVIGGSIASLGVMAWMNWETWKARKRYWKSMEEYNAAMEAAIKALKENPERWLDYHKALDDQRRKH